MNATNFRSEYLPSPTAEKQSVNANKPPWELTRDMYVLASVDPRISHPALRLLVLITEYSFWRIYGGNGHGSLRARNKWLRKQMRSASKNQIGRWSKELVDAGYVWIQKVKHHRTKFPAHIFHLSCLVSKNDTPDLFVEYAPMRGMPVPDNIVPIHGDGFVPTDGDGSSPLTGTVSSPPRGSVQTGRLGDFRGKGSQPPQPAQNRVHLNGDSDNWSKWVAGLDKLFPRELKDKRELIVSKIKSLKSDPSNFELKLKPAVQEWLDHVNQQLAAERKKRRPDKKLIATREAEIERNTDPKQNPHNFEHGPLKNGPRQILANLTRKREAIDHRLA